MRAVRRVERSTNRSAIYANARNADAGPFVTVNGPEPNGNSTTTATPKVANSATFRQKINMISAERNAATRFGHRSRVKVAVFLLAFATPHIQVIAKYRRRNDG